MCHRRSDWSRASSSVGEHASEADDDRERADDRERERAPLATRARERLAALVPTGERAEEKPISTGAQHEQEEEPETEDPVPADD